MTTTATYCGKSLVSTPGTCNRREGHAGLCSGSHCCPEHDKSGEQPVHYLPTIGDRPDCPTCTWPNRETVNMVCQTCGMDYS